MNLLFVQRKASSVLIGCFVALAIMGWRPCRSACAFDFNVGGVLFFNDDYLLLRRTEIGGRNKHLIAVDLRHSNKETILSSDVNFVAVSSDGRYAAYTENYKSGLWLYDAVAAGVVKFSDNFCYGAEFSTDGKKIAYIEIIKDKILLRISGVDGNNKLTVSETALKE